MAEFIADFNADAYFMRRLSQMRRLSMLPATVQFDLARSPIDDDELDQLSTAYGVTPSTGWGISDVLHEALSAQPRTAPVDDLKQLQENLKREGYLPPVYQPTGQWDDLSYSAMKRADRDAADAARSGKGFLSSALAGGVHILTDTLPSFIWQNTVGAAKGVIEQTPEALDRLGLVGGGAAGAAIGGLAGSIAGPPGAAIGAVAGTIIGGIAGFVTSLAGEEEEEPESSNWSHVIDALTPWQEWYPGNKDGVRNFFRDLSYVATAATLVQGSKLAVGGTKAALGMARGAQTAAVGAEAAVGGVEGAAFQMQGGALLGGPAAGRTLGQALLRPGATAAPTGLLRTALGHPVATGAVVGSFQGLASAGAGPPPGAVDNEDGTWTLENGQTVPAPEPPGFADLIQGALWGAGIGFVFRSSLKTFPTWGKGVSEFRSILEKRSLGSRPVFQLVNKNYSALARTSVGVRLTAGLGFEDDPTPLERSITETAPFTTGIEVPIGGDLVDWAAFVLFPEKWFPIGGKQLAASADRMLGPQMTRAIAHVAQNNAPNMSFRGATSWATEFFNNRPDELTRIWLEYSVYREAIDKLNVAKTAERRQQYQLGAFMRSLKRTVKDEAEAGGSATRAKLLDKATADMASFEAWFIRQVGAWDKPGYEAIEDYVRAQDVVRRTEVEMRSTGMMVEEAPSQLALRPEPGGAFRPRTPQLVVPPGAARTGERLEELAVLRAQIGRLEKAISRGEKSLNRTLDDFVAVQYGARLDLLKAELSRMKDQFATISGESKLKMRSFEDIHLTSAKLEFPTRRDYANANREYKRLKAELKDLRKAADAGDEGARRAMVMKNVEFDTFVFDLERRDMIPKSAADHARAAQGKGPIVENLLEVNGAMAARDVELPSNVMSELRGLGYKPVVTGDEVFLAHEMEGLGQLLQIPEYRKSRGFIETLGFSPRYATDEALAGISWAYMQSQVGHVLRVNDVPITGAGALNRLNEFLRKTRDRSLIEAPGVLRPLATAIESVNFKADIRRLSPEQVYAALSDVPNVTVEVAGQIFDGLKIGNAFGGELKMLRPRQSAYVIGRSLRTLGWPGFAQVVRSWHAKDFTTQLISDKIAKGRLEYRPVKAGLERARAVNELRDAAARRGLDLSDANRIEQVYDAMADAAVRYAPDVYRSTDDFFRHITVEAADDYVRAGDQLLQTRWLEKTPTRNRLTALAGRFADSRFWYEDATQTLAETFSYGRTRLRNGTDINDFDLMVDLIAATSPLKGPIDNMDLAMKVLLSHKAGESLPGMKPNVRIMVDEILDGKPISTWDASKRRKVNAFSANIRGDLDRVTVDTWMYRLFGKTRINSKGETVAADSLENFKFIEQQVRDLADRLGWHPAQAQAALWAAFKDESATYMEKLARDALKRGNTAEASALRADVLKVRRAEDFSHAIRVPKIRGLVEDYQQHLGQRLLQRVEDTVRGSVEFGPDMGALIRVYQTGGFDTLVHEAAHVMRRILPADVVRQFETKYGVGSPDTLGMHPVSPEEFVAARAKLAEAQPGERFEHVLTWYTPEQIREQSMKAFLSADGKVGFMLVPDGGIANVFNAGGPKGAGSLATIEAIRMGGTQVEHFEGKLSEIYGKLGFKEAERYPFDPDIMLAEHPLYDIEKYGRPDYLVERLSEEARTRILERPMWSDAAEERFAQDFTAYVVGALKGEPGPLRALKEAVATVWGRNREAWLDRGIVPIGLYRQFDDMFGDSLKAAGIHKPKTVLASKQTIGGAILGATEGAVEGDDVNDILTGALLGGAVGLGVNKAVKRTYGYLPDALANLNMALRYTLSFTFDAGRYMEQNTIAYQKYGLRMFLSPRKFTMRNEWRSPYATGTITGQEAWRDVHRFFDEVNGVNYFERLAETEQKLFQRGVLGFSPRDFEAVQAFQMYQLGWGRDQIREAVANLGRYGLGRTVAERSANFIVFPFSFAKKLLVTIGDFIGQAPGRNLLITEGLRRYHESLLDEQFHDLVMNRAPLLEQLWMVNNLAFGMSLGRFFLEGIDDRRSNVGRVMQYMAAVFVPSGAATPMQQAAGALGDYSVNAFTPLVLTGESISRAGGIDGLTDIFRRYVPFLREVDNYARAISDQAIAAVSPQHMTPWSQFQMFAEQKRALQDAYAPIATGLGYSTVEGFLGSPLGATALREYEKDVEELRRQYPNGWAITTSFENSAAIDEAALLELADKPNKTEPEIAFLELLERQKTFEAWSSVLPPEMTRGTEQAAIRAFAQKWRNDRRFVELYDRFMLRDYGPIRMIA